MKTKKETLTRIRFNKLKPLFWVYDGESVKKHLDSAFVISRILELGNPEQFEIFRSIISDEKIKDFLKSEKVVLKIAELTMSLI